jgi:hypothetical protein
VSGTEVKPGERCVADTDGPGVFVGATVAGTRTIGWVVLDSTPMRAFYYSLDLILPEPPLEVTVTFTEKEAGILLREYECSDPVAHRGNGPCEIGRKIKEAMP